MEHFFALKQCVESLNSKSKKTRLIFRGSGPEKLFIIIGTSLQWNEHNSICTGPNLSFIPK